MQPRIFHTASLFTMITSSSSFTLQAEPNTDIWRKPPTTNTWSGKFILSFLSLSVAISCHAHPAPHQHQLTFTNHHHYHSNTNNIIL
jgi:hypothetical protein